MTSLVTEFESNNHIEFEEAYDRAREYVEQEKAVPIVDVYSLVREARINAVELTMHANRFPEISEDPSPLISLVQRQSHSAVSLYIGIAAVGGATPADITALDASLGPNLGPRRWVESAGDAEELYTRMVRWLLIVLSRRRSGGPGTGTLAQDAIDTINSNLPAGTDSESGIEFFWGPT